MSFDHLLTYQHNVQKYFRKHADSYQGIVVPISIASSFPTGTYGFVRALCTKDDRKTYSIDPRTALFQKNWNREKLIRDPHKTVAKIFGPPFDSAGIVRALRASDFSDPSVVERVARKCIEYQLAFGMREEDKRKLSKYAKMLGVSELAPLAEPLFVTPPYFEFHDQTDEWYRVNIDMCKSALAASGDITVRPVIHLQDIKAIASWKAIADDLTSLGIRQMWIYPNKFKEHDKSERDLVAYRHAISQLRSHGLEVWAMFGGYFAIMLSKYGLNGFSNGVGYGEWRDSGYARGGSAVTRIYVYRLHKYVSIEEAQLLIEHDMDYFGHRSELLRECAEDERPVSEVSNSEVLDDFMICRAAEIHDVGLIGVDEIAAELEETIERFEGMSPFFIEKHAPSLKRWKSTLQKVEIDTIR